MLSSKFIVSILVNITWIDLYLCCYVRCISWIKTMKNKKMWCVSEVMQCVPARVNIICTHLSCQNTHYPQTTYVTSKWYLAFLFLCITHRPRMSQANGILPSYFCALPTDHICHKQMVSCLPISVHYPQTTYVTSKWYLAFLFLCINHRPHMSQGNGILPSYFCALPTDHICHKQMVSCLPISVH